MRALWHWLRWWLLAGIAVGFAAWRGLLWWTEWLWFNSLGFQSVFVKAWSTRVGFLLLGLALGALVLPANFLYSRRIDRVPAWARPRPGELTGGPVLWAILPFVLLLAAIVFGTSLAQLWAPFLLMLNGVAAGQPDPIFGRDTAWYLTSLPFWLNLQKLIFGLFATTWVALYFRYAELPVPGDPESYGDFRAVSEPARRHLSWLGALVFALAAWGLWLARFNLLVTSRTHILHGVAYTDAHVRIPLLNAFAVGAALVALLLLLNVRRPTLGRLFWPIGVFAGLYVLSLAVPPVVQALVVRPSELDRERPYLQHCIDGTRAALGLDQADVQQYTVNGGLSRDQLADEEATLSTVPLWSPTELTEQIVGTEALRGYYNFLLADYDRYDLGGRRQQVAVVARELQVDRLDPTAQNWVNRHLVYTHGFGLVMASAHDTGPAGEPVKLIRDIPPRTPPELPLAQPRIYYGEFPADYIITGLKASSQTQELDYPSGERNVTTRYDGRGGLPLGGFLRRLALAMRFGSVNILISDLPAADARFHFRRSLYERLEAIAPFLDYDSEPYPVIAGGRLVWLVDAYTVSSRYPYGLPYDLAPAAALAQEQPEREARTRAAYVRNSVKVTIDAYDGTVRFHVFDSKDPLLLSYARAFPALFTTEPLPAELAAHIRYPSDLFALQAQAYARFHMTTPDVFYTSEDLWDIAREEDLQRAPQTDGTYRFVSRRERVMPYFVLLRLPGETTAKFRQIVPFTPASSSGGGTGRDNMIGWLAADCDPASYGRLTVFAFPKNTLVYGPMQVEALIDQDPEISAQRTLWDQQGSRVVRGRLLVIPIRDSLLYVEPWYISAERRGALPELKRVVVFYHGRVRMATTLNRALELALSGEREGGGAVEMMRLRRLAQQAQAVWAQADAARRRGDLPGYGQALAKVGEALEQLGANAGTSTSTQPAPSAAGTTTQPAPTVREGVPSPGGRAAGDGERGTATATAPRR